MLIDTITYNLMRSIENPILTTTTKTISLIFDPIILTIIVIIISACLFFKSQKKQGIFLVSIILITAILIKLSKEIIQRARPLNPIITETGFSFPSGHTTMSIIFFGLLTYMFIKNNSIKTKITTTLIVLAVAFSRIYLRVHWLTDVIAGIILGTIILILSIKVYNKIITSS